MNTDTKTEAGSQKAEASTPTGYLWTCVARCRVCGKELNRAEHVPAADKLRVALAAPLVAICEVRSHNTASDFNPSAELEWILEPGHDQETRKGIKL